MTRGERGRRRCASEELLLFQVVVVGPHVTVHQAVAVPFDGGRFVVARLIEQLGQRAVVVQLRRPDRGRLGERRRPLRSAVLLHRHGHVRVLLGRDVVRAAGQLGLLSFVPHVERDARQRNARRERQQAQQQRGAGTSAL